MRSALSLLFGTALLLACGDDGSSSTGLSVGGVTETSTATASTSTASTSTGGTPTTGVDTTGSGSDSASTTALPTTDPGTTAPGTSTSTTDPSTGTTDPSTGTTGSTGTTEPVSSSSTGTTDDSTTGPVCGDGVIDAGEVCDGADLDGATCMSLGFLQGQLACDATCQLDTSGCMGMPECAVALMPPGGPMCPPECTGGCDMNTNTCRVNCDGNVCDNATITCPANWACEVSCNGTTACEDATIHCPAQYACDILCIGTAPCRPATFNCGDGPCNITCDGTAPCDDAIFNCGLGNGLLTCDVTSSDPVVVPDPMSMCLCQAVGC